MPKQDNHVGKVKDLEVPGVTLVDNYTGSNRSAETPKRGFEPHVGGYANPTDARKIAGSGHQGFGRGGSGPDVSTGMDRGDFASRTKLTSKP